MPASSRIGEWRVVAEIKDIELTQKSIEFIWVIRGLNVVSAGGQSFDVFLKEPAIEIVGRTGADNQGASRRVGSARHRFYRDRARHFRCHRDEGRGDVVVKAFQGQPFDNRVI